MVAVIKNTTTISHSSCKFLYIKNVDWSNSYLVETQDKARVFLSIFESLALSCDVYNTRIHNSLRSVIFGSTSQLCESCIFTVMYKL